MAIEFFLAMTEPELRQSHPLPGHPAWMACHFSPYQLGLSDCPNTLPAGSMLILDDRIEPVNHDKAVIDRQLRSLVERYGIKCILLDFQRETHPLLQEMAAHLTRQPPCPTAVTPQYAAALSCPVFLPPAPPHRPLKEHLAAWEGRTVWLEVAKSCTALSVTESGCRPCPIGQPDTPMHHAPELHTHYYIETAPNELRFTFHRTAQDLSSLLAEAEKLSVEKAVGLYQELWDLDV